MKKSLLILAVVLATIGCYVIGYRVGHSSANDQWQVFTMSGNVQKRELLKKGNARKVEEIIAVNIYVNYEDMKRRYGSNLPASVLKRKELIEQAIQEFGWTNKVPSKPALLE